MSTGALREMQELEGMQGHGEVGTFLGSSAFKSSGGQVHNGRHSPYLDYLYGAFQSSITVVVTRNPHVAILALALLQYIFHNKFV